jgi:hypothetical protein
MPALRIFDPYAFLGDEAKASAEAYDPEPEGARAFAALATLAGVSAENSVSARSHGEDPGTDPISADEARQNDKLPVTAAKVAKDAKAEADAAADPTFWHDPSDSIRRDCGNVPQTESQLIAPAPWFERYASRREEEPPYDQPCPDRRGRDEREGVAHLHFCAVCGAWGAWGYGVGVKEPGRWFCFQHRPPEG